MEACLSLWISSSFGFASCVLNHWRRESNRGQVSCFKVARPCRSSIHAASTDAKLFQVSPVRMQPQRLKCTGQVGIFVQH